MALKLPKEHLGAGAGRVVLKAMLDRGLFIVKGGVERAAAALGVTRFTVYNYLDSIRSQRRRDGR